MTSTSSSTPRLLPHQLVPRDRRSSYIKRVETLAGPGAYLIPSTFKTTEVNAQVREVHMQQYGREFARQQRRATLGEIGTIEEPIDDKGETVLSPQQRRDRYLMRRERLRELLEQLGERQYHPDDSDAAPALTLVAHLASESLPQSPSLSCTSNFEGFVEGYRQHQQSQQGRRSSVGSCTHTMSVRSPTSPTSCDFASVGFGVESPRQRRRSSATTKPGASLATSPAPTPLTYRQYYLSTTSYSKRHQRRSYDSSAGGSTVRPSPAHHRHPSAN